MRPVEQQESERKLEVQEETRCRWDKDNQAKPRVVAVDQYLVSYLSLFSLSVHTYFLSASLSLLLEFLIIRSYPLAPLSF